MEGGAQAGVEVDEIASKPNRAAIVLAIGDVGELSFSGLKAKMNLGVGTLYYHLDALKGVVAQNGSRQYVLTDAGKAVYQKIKEIEGLGKPSPRHRLPSVKDALGEAFLFDSHIERLALDPMSNLSITLGVLLTGAILAGTARVYDSLFFIQGRFVAPGLAFFTVPISWVILFGITVLLVNIIWKPTLSLSGLAGGCALSLVPVIFYMALEAMRRTFSPNLDFLGALLTLPYYPIFEGVLIVWGAYILAVSVRSASDLNLEKAMVVVLLIVIINLAYVWGRPLILPVH